MAYKKDKRKCPKCGTYKPLTQEFCNSCLRDKTKNISDRIDLIYVYFASFIIILFLLFNFIIVPFIIPEKKYIIVFFLIFIVGYMPIFYVMKNWIKRKIQKKHLK